MSVANDNTVPEKSVDEILHSVRNMMESDIGSLQEEGEAAANAEVVLLTEMIKPPKGYKSVKDFYASKEKADKPVAPPVETVEEPSKAPNLSGDLEARIHESLEPIILEWLDKKVAPIIRDTLDKEIKHLVQSMVAEAVKNSKIK